MVVYKNLHPRTFRVQETERLFFLTNADGNTQERHVLRTKKPFLTGGKAFKKATVNKTAKAAAFGTANSSWPGRYLRRGQSAEIFSVYFPCPVGGKIHKNSLPSPLPNVPVPMTGRFPGLWICKKRRLPNFSVTLRGGHPGRVCPQ